MYITAVLKPDETLLQNTSAAAPVSDTTEDFADCLNEVQSDGSLASIFEKASETYGVSMSLLTAMAKQESNFQADATSKSGAMGIMQLMPATAAHFGCTEPYDPEQNIMAGAEYISQLLDKYDGDVSLALAAYNAGSGNVDKYGGIPPFEETQNYVAKITAYMEEGVTLPDGTSISGSSSISSIASSLLEKLGSNDFQEILNKIFSYDDYLKFMNLFLKELSNAADAYVNNNTAQTTSGSTDSASTGNAGSSNAADDTKATAKTLDVTVTSTPDTDAYYAYQSINYNNSVLNLLSQK